MMRRFLPIIMALLCHNCFAQVQHMKVMPDIATLQGINPNDFEKSVYVNGIGTFVWDPTGTGANDVVSTRQSNGRWVYKPNGSQINAKAFGAKCDDSTDDSGAILKAMKFAYDQGGGTVYIPGRSAFNIVNPSYSNVSLAGDGSVKDFSGPVTSYWRPYDTTRPLIQVGNDTAYVRGFTIMNATLYGYVNSTSAGLYFGAGAFENYVYNTTVWRFKTNYLFKGGATYPCSLIFIHGFNTEPSTAANARGIYALMPSNQSSYTTGIFFSHGHVGGPSGSGAYAAEIDGTFISMNSVYFDMDGSDKGIKFSKTFAGVLDPYIDCNDVKLDSNSSSDVLVTVYTNEKKLESWMRGNVTCDGLLKILAGTTWRPPIGPARIPYQSEMSWPQVAGHMAFSDGSHTDWAEDQAIYSDGNLILTNSIAGIKLHAEGSVDIKPTIGSLNLYGGGSGVYILGANMFFENGRALYFKDSGGVDRMVISSSGDNIILGSGGNLFLSPSGTTIIGSGGAGVSIFGGTSQSIVTSSADMYFDNGRALLAKSSGGTYFYWLRSIGDSTAVQAKTDIHLYPGNAGAAAGDVTVDTTLGGFVIPRLTKSQRNALVPLNGTIIYQTDNTPGLREYRGGAWGIAGWTADP